jgi:2-iminobutanoate/2-iminopropanoate deaminase
MFQKSASTPGSIAKPVGPYSHAWKVRAGDTNIIFVAGQVGVDHNGEVVGKNDMRAQTRQTLYNLQVILAENGASFRDVVKMNTYVTDINLRHEVSEARAEFLHQPYPISTYLEVSKLIDPDWLIEIECVAVIPA